MSDARSRATNGRAMPEDVPYTMLLPDKRTVFVMVPGRWCGRDLNGELTFKPQAIRLLDRVRVLAMQMPRTPTPGFIRTLRQAMRLTQKELGQKIGVDKLTVYRWEAGMMKPGPESIKALEALRKRAARKGLTLAA